MDDLIIVDCQYDFIDGTLACAHSHEAVAWLVDFINTHEVRALYTSDWHSETNGSFKKNGGIWPVHCVAGSEGAALDPSFARDIKRSANRPSKENLFLKGLRDDVEEYSAFHGMNAEGKALHDVASSHVYVGGIASEYCVKEKGGRIEIVTDQSGTQKGICNLPDGTAVDEWELFRKDHPQNQ